MEDKKNQEKPNQEPEAPKETEPSVQTGETENTTMPAKMVTAVPAMDMSPKPKTTRKSTKAISQEKTVTKTDNNDNSNQ